MCHLIAVIGQTAAEIVYNRADAKKDNMGLTNWGNSPDGKILKSDVVIAKNYLNEKEIKDLKSTFRKRVDEITRKSLFLKQDCKCAICGKNIDVSSPIDHIIPFKYVGDELANNLQTLCKSCNDKKNASLDYQIRFLLKLV